jgi:hypothetical protein
LPYSESCWPRLAAEPLSDDLPPEEPPEEELLPDPEDEVDLPLFVSLVLASFLEPKTDFPFPEEDDLEPEDLLVSLFDEVELLGELEPELPVLLPVLLPLSEELPNADEDDALGELPELPELLDELPELDEPPERFEDSLEPWFFSVSFIV